MFTDGNGPSLTVNGIDAGDKKITKVKAGTEDTDAVNFAQLNEIKDEMAGNSLVKWDEGKKLITIGAQKGGTKIDITGTEGERTIAGIKNGTISEDSKEAINGSQINKISGDIAKFFGGNAAFRDGAFVGPRYNLSIVSADGTVKQNEYTDVGSALTGLDANVKNVNSRLTNVSNEFNQKIEGISKDALLWSEDEQAFVALHEKDGKQIDYRITHILDGDVNEESTDAINGSQLYSMGSRIAKHFGGNASFENGVFTGPTYELTTIAEDDTVSTENYTDVGKALDVVNKNVFAVDHRITVGFLDIADYFGGGAKYEKGKWHAPTFKVSQRDADGTIVKKEHHNVADAFEGVNTSITDIYSQINNVTENSLVKWDEGYKLITIGAEKDGTRISVRNSEGHARNINGVAVGRIAIDSADAINGSQLFYMGTDIARYFGGKTSFENGVFVGPRYNLSIVSADGTVKQNEYTDVGSALTGLDANVKNVNSRLTNVSNEFNQKIEGISKDALLWSEDEQAFVALHEKDGEKTKSKLKYLLDGEIHEESTDAINGSQLYFMSNQLAAYFGGGAKYENGKWTAPNFVISQVNADGTISEKTHHNVADAFGGVNSGMLNINNRIDEIKNNIDSDVLHWNKAKGAYDASHDGQPSKIINVADGTIAEDSKDAVNGGQLWKTNERITGVEKDIKHIENRVDNISTTVTNIGETVHNIDIKVDNIDNKVNDLVDGVVLYDRDANGKKVNKVTLIGGNESEPVTIDNVADGKIGTGSKEAVNGGQLHEYTQEQMKIVLDESKHYTDQRINNIRIDAIDEAVERANNYTNMKFEALNYSIENVRKEAKQAAAIGLAVSNLRYNDTPGKLSVAFGSGLWRGQSAFALGAGYSSEDGKIRSNLSATSSGGHWGVGLGLNLTLN